MIEMGIRKDSLRNINNEQFVDVADYEIDITSEREHVFNGTNYSSVLVYYVIGINLKTGKQRLFFKDSVSGQPAMCIDWVSKNWLSK